MSKHMDLLDFRREIETYARDNNLTYNPIRNVYERPSFDRLDPGTQVSPSDLADRCYTDCRSGPKDCYRVTMRMIQQDLRDKARAHVAAYLCTVDEDFERAQMELRTLVKLMAHPDTDDERLRYYTVGWEQLIWQVKRRLLNKPTSWEVMLSLVSRKQGTGKTATAQQFGALLGQFFMPDADCELLADKFRFAGFERYFLILLDEFDKANRAQVSTFKRLISSKTVSGRQIYSDTEVQLERNASFIVTSNRSIAFDITDSSMRRFVEIKCRESRVNDDFVARMQGIDWALVWSAANAYDDVAPAERESALFDKYQQELASASDFETWRLECTEEDAMAKTAVRELFSNYKQWSLHCGNRYMLRKHFSRECDQLYSVVKPGGLAVARGVALRIPEW